MKATEYITQLQALIALHGDLELVDDNDDPVSAPEFNDDLGPAVFVA